MYTVYFDHILRPPILFGTPQPCPSPNFMSSFILTYQVQLVLPMTQKYESDSISQRSTKASLSLWFFVFLSCKSNVRNALISQSSTSMKRRQDHNSYKRNQLVGSCIEFQRFSPFLAWQGAWWHTGRQQLRDLHPDQWAARRETL